jgi:hypothetical protein
MTPLPGTPLFDQYRDQMVEKDWSKFDMHHILWEPRLGRERFFELFGECWRRTVLNARSSGRKPWWKWLAEVSPRQIPTLARVLWSTQRMMDPKAYLRETFPLQPASPAPAVASLRR